MDQLDNESMVVTFDDHAAITGIFDRKTGRDYIKERKLSNACRLMMPDKRWDGRFADTKAQKFPRVERKERELSFLFSEMVTEDGKETKVFLKLTYTLQGDEIRAAYEIDNRDEEEFVSHVMFPILTGIGREYKDCRLIMPEQSPFGNSRIEDPFAYGDGNHKDWTRSCNRKSVRYPQLLTTAWMDYSDDCGGISLEQRSEGFAVCDFGFERVIVKDRYTKEKNIDCLQLALQSYPSVRQGERIRSSPYVIGVHEGGWKVPARIHRNWLKDRLDFPQISERFRRSLGWHFFFMKQQDGTVYRNYDDLPEMAGAAIKAGLSHMMVFGWYQAGHDNEYPYGYYANEEWGGKEKLIEQIRQCEEAGCSVIPFFNGTLLDISTEGYRRYGYRWPVLGRTGKPYCGTEFSRANHDLSFANACLTTSTRNMTLLDICITAGEVKDWWYETVTRIAKDYRFHNLQLDQIAHKSYVCYDRKHHHKRPDTAYTEELEELLKKIREIVKTENPDGVMVGEGMTDLTMQYCDAFWNWHQAWNHPEIIRYSIPWMNYSHEVDANEYDAVNLCFAEKIWIDLKVEGGDGIVTDYPEFCIHLKELADLKSRTGKAYLDGEYWHEDRIVRKSAEGIILRIYQWKNEIDFVIANLTKEDREWEAVLDCSLREVKVLATKEEKKIAEGSFYKYSMKPYEVMVIEGSIEGEGTYEDKNGKIIGTESWNISTDPDMGTKRI